MPPDVSANLLIRDKNSDERWNALEEKIVTKKERVSMKKRKEDDFMILTADKSEWIPR
jgi:hypothetical protein